MRFEEKFKTFPIKRDSDCAECIDKIEDVRWKPRAIKTYDIQNSQKIENEKKNIVDLAKKEYDKLKFGREELGAPNGNVSISDFSSKTSY